MNEPISINPEQMAHLEALIAKEMAKTRAEMKAEIRAAASPFRDRAGAASFLKVVPDTIDRYKRQGRLNPKYVGDKPLYPVVDLLKFPTKAPTHEPDYDPAA